MTAHNSCVNETSYGYAPASDTIRMHVYIHTYTYREKVASYSSVHAARPIRQQYIMCKGIVHCTKGSNKGIAIYGHGKHHLWAVLACTKEVPTTCELVLPPTDCLKRVLVTILLSTEGVRHGCVRHGCVFSSPADSAVPCTYVSTLTQLVGWGRVGVEFDDACRRLE